MIKFRLERKGQAQEFTLHPLGRGWTLAQWRDGLPVRGIGIYTEAWEAQRAALEYVEGASR